MTDEITYPVRCRIVEASGREIAPGLVTATPPESGPHIGKTGLAEEVPDPDGFFGTSVRITLDDGGIIYGYECWWIPLEWEAFQ